MKLIVGLGNPGPDYAATRHNVGFMAIDRLAARLAPDAVMRSRFQSGTFDAWLDDEKLMLLKPMTYMNRSGQAVGEAARFFKLEPDEILVIVDDVALPQGTIRLRPRGSAGTHNGLADIENHLGTDAYHRVRVGIDSPGRLSRTDYVLGRFGDDEFEPINQALDQTVDATCYWVREGITKAMSRFNKRGVGDPGAAPESNAVENEPKTESNVNEESP